MVDEIETHGLPLETIERRTPTARPGKKTSFAGSGLFEPGRGEAPQGLRFLTGNLSMQQVHTKSSICKLLVEIGDGQY
jgi:hypothetical protein